MNKASQKELVRRLRGEGLKFHEFILQTEGEYATEDADWNYKDIPHLHHIHELAEAYPAVMDNQIICSINLQSILGIWFPIALVNYEYQKDVQVYFTTLFFFVLVIETRIETLGELRTRVRTNYALGYPRWLFFMVPLLKILIKRNYKVLMAADIPMRQRRGALRKLGYRFKKEGESYGFAETIDIGKNNLQLPPTAQREFKCNYIAVLGDSSEALIGDIGLLGFRLIKEGSEISIFPRTCPHEGASLDQARCHNDQMSCPWHGRVIKPIGKFRWKENAVISTKSYLLTIREDQLLIERLEGAE